MGVSTDAILVYGVALQEDAISTDEINRHDSEEDAPETGPAWLAWSGETEDGVGILTHQSGSCPAHLVVIAKTERQAWRGHPQRIDPARLTVHPSWDGKIAAALKRWGLDKKVDRKTNPKAKPAWLLCSYWSE